jgi:Xaa-Pro dipeptidase
MVLAAFFRQHIAQRQKTTDLALRECRYDALVIGAGALNYHTEDDRSYPFRSYHHFNHWCPARGPNHLLLIRPGQKPTLLAHMPLDFWHEHADLSDAFWLSEFEMKSFATEDEIWAQVKNLPFTAYIGPDKNRAESYGLRTETSNLLARLNWERSFKSDYEIKCTVRSTRRAATGHVAAREAFFAGGSELDIHHAYIRAMRCTDYHLPYETIVCLNEKASILHYQRKRDKTRMGKTFLIDAGFQYKGYASDITRSYAADEAPEEFRSLLSGMSKLQQRLCLLIKPGLSFEHLHAQAHSEIAHLLIEHDLIRGISHESAVELGLSAVFFPHGLGHMLGLCVHDVGGTQSDRTGAIAPSTGRFKNLRTRRILDAGNLITVEPGIYFIDLLLGPQKVGANATYFNWALIEQLAPCGGIRIEDDVLVTRSGIRNITREFLP